MRRRSSAAFACMRAGISSENSSNKRSGIGLLPSPRLRRGGVGGGGSIGIDYCINRRKNARQVRQDVVVPEAQNTIAVRFEIVRAHFIGDRVSMLTAIDLKNNFGLMTSEVGEISTDGSLASKVM